jgi:hypothetical protein
MDTDFGDELGHEGTKTRRETSHRGHGEHREEETLNAKHEILNNIKIHRFK